MGKLGYGTHVLRAFDRKPSRGLVEAEGAVAPVGPHLLHPEAAQLGFGEFEDCGSVAEALLVEISRHIAKLVRTQLRIHW